MRIGLGPTALVGAACAIGGFAAGLAAQSSDAMRVVPIEQARFAPADPARPNGTQVAVLRGDPATGPSDMLMLMKKGEGQLHVHSSDYRLVLLRGTAIHWAPGDAATQSRRLEPGSYWFQPGNDPHGDSCASDECLMFITWSGKRDGRLVDAPAPKP